MKSKIILDTGNLRPNRLCLVCGLPLASYPLEGLVVQASGQVNHYRHLEIYHTGCYEERRATHGEQQ